MFKLLGGGDQTGLRLAALFEEFLLAGAGIGLVADPNGAFDFPAAVTLARRLVELGYLWLEEPLDPADVAGLARLPRRRRRA